MILKTYKSNFSREHWNHRKQFCQYLPTPKYQMYFSPLNFFGPRLVVVEEAAKGQILLKADSREIISSLIAILRALQKLPSINSKRYVKSKYFLSPYAEELVVSHNDMNFTNILTLKGMPTLIDFDELSIGPRYKDPLYLLFKAILVNIEIVYSIQNTLLDTLGVSNFTPDLRESIMKYLINLPGIDSEAISKVKYWAYSK